MSKRQALVRHKPALVGDVLEPLEIRGNEIILPRRTTVGNGDSIMFEYEIVAGQIQSAVLVHPAKVQR
jgi:hypothetical protein